MTKTAQPLPTFNAPEGYMRTNMIKVNVGVFLKYIYTI